MSKKRGIHVSNESIAHSFGRHSKEVMEKHYLIPEKETTPIEALNLIREAHDLTGITEKDTPNPFRRQQRILKNLRQNNSLKNKRNSLEILTQNFEIPTQSVTAISTQITPKCIDKENVQLVKREK